MVQGNTPSNLLLFKLSFNFLITVSKTIITENLNIKLCVISYVRLLGVCNSGLLIQDYRVTTKKFEITILVNVRGESRRKKY